MPIPLAVAAAAAGIPAVASGVANWFGSKYAASEARRANRQYQEGLDKAFGVMKGQQDTYNKAYDPIISSVPQDYAAYREAVAGYKQPTMNYQQSDFSFDKYNDPGAKYRMAQANAAIQAAGIAKGNMGGAMARDLQTNSQDMASQEYAKAFDRWGDESKMRYSQASDQYSRDADFANNYLMSRQNLATHGLGAMKDWGSTNADYAGSMANLYSQGGAAKSNTTSGVGNMWAGAIGNMANNAGSAIKTGMGYYYGNKNPWDTIGDDGTVKNGRVGNDGVLSDHGFGLA